MRTDRLLTVLFQAALPLTLLTGCTERGVGTPTQEAPERVAENTSPSAEVERLRSGIRVAPLSPELAAAVALRFDGDVELWRRPRAEVASTLAAAADAGEVRAAHILGTRLLGCDRVLRDNRPAEVLQRYHDDLAEAQTRAGTPMHETLRRNADNRFAAQVDDYRDCRDVPAAMLAKAAEWLEQAAAAGHPEARRAYPQLAMSEFETREGVIRNPKEAQRRRALARSYLEEAVAAGDRQALRTFVEAQAGRGPLYPENRRTMQVYSYVQELASLQPRANLDPQVAALQARVDQRRVASGGQSQDARFRTLLAEGPPRYPPGAYTDAEWADMVAQGRRIFETAYRSSQ